MVVAWCEEKKGEEVKGMVKRIVTYRKESGESESPFKIILDEQSVAWNEERQRERVAAGKTERSLYASDVFQCSRKVWFQFFPDRYPTEGFDPRVLRIFHNGESVHERLSEYFAKSDVVFLEEEDVPRDVLGVHGRCDGVALLQGRFFVLEFKSINRRTVYQAKEEHVGQLMWYMYMWECERVRLREEFGVPEGMSYGEEDLCVMSGDERGWSDLSMVERMLLLSEGEVRGEVIYESKQTQSLFHFPFELDMVLVEKVKKWFEDVQYHVDMERMPHVRYDKNKFPCRWRGGQCAYWEVCHGDKKDSGKQDEKSQDSTM